MDTDKNAPGLLDTAFLIVVFTSLSAGLLHNSAVGSGDISEILVNISSKLTLYRISILVDMVTSLGVVVLAGLLFTVLNKQNRIMAIIAFGWWLAEAMSLALSKTGSLALISLSLDYVKDVPIYVYLPILPFELTIGTWLMLRGIEDDSDQS